MNYGYGINGAIEQLDYTVHLTMGDHEECVRFFAEHPVFGTVGYASYEDAEDDLHGFLGIGQFLDTCESMVNAGYDGDHFYFDRQEMLVKVRCDYWKWTWTPETGLIYDPQSKPVYPKNKSRRAVRVEQNKQHKGSDRAHGKKRPMSRKDRMRAEDDRAQQERPVGMWRENCKGDWAFRPFQRTNRHNNYVSPEQDRLNALNVLGENVTSEDIQWAKDICVRAAYNNGYADEISNDLNWVLANAETLEREIALVTVITQSWWHDEFEGIEICLPATKDCFTSIEAKEYLPLCKNYDNGLIVAKYDPYH